MVDNDNDDNEKAPAATASSSESSSSSSSSSSNSCSWSFVPIQLLDDNKGTTATTIATAADDDDANVVVEINQEIVDKYRKDGFIQFHVPLITNVELLNQQLEEVLRGRYSLSQPPTKAPKIFKNEYAQSPYARNRQHDDNDDDEDNGAEKEEDGGNKDGLSSSSSDVHSRGKKTKNIMMKLRTRTTIVGPIGDSGNRHNVKVIQIINIHKANHLFRKLASHPLLGRLVATLTGWSSVRLANDQIWAKPPFAGCLSFHQDSPYFMFTPPNQVVTVWIAFDDMNGMNIGPLIYVKGSHLWKQKEGEDDHHGIAGQFFDKGHDLLQRASMAASNKSNATAAVAESKQQDDGDMKDDELEFVSVVGMPRGGLSVHDGWTWHGSGKNMTTNRPRRGWGLHYVPGNVRFTTNARYSTLWKPYIQQALDEANGDMDHLEELLLHLEVPEQDFPIVWPPPPGTSG